MQVDLKGQVALVTGGAMGIGRAIAERLAANGAAVAILDSSEAPRTKRPARSSAGGGRAIALAGDVADSARMQACRGRNPAPAWSDQHPGQQRGHQHVERTPADPRVFRRRLGPHPARRSDRRVHVSKAVVPGMLERGGGRIVNIASVAGLVPLRLQSAYVAAKAGVVNLTRSMALELGPQGILSNCVAPGSILTRGTRAPVLRPEGRPNRNRQEPALARAAGPAGHAGRNCPRRNLSRLARGQLHQRRRADRRRRLDGRLYT